MEIMKKCANSAGMGVMVLCEHDIEIYIEPVEEQPNYYYVMFCQGMCYLEATELVRSQLGLEPIELKKM